MKIFAFLLFFLALIPGLVWAAPFLVCDPADPLEGITYYEIIMDSSPPIKSPAVNNALHQDMASVSTGSHTVKAKACNVWGCSGEANLNFTKSFPGIPTTISIASQ
jgi:hypothetical protein